MMLKPQTAQQIITEFIAKERLPPEFTALAEDHFVPLGAHIEACCRTRRLSGNSPHSCARTLVVGINGAQGTGKSTLALLLKQLLQARQLECVVLSIDDLYLTRAERIGLASDVHPLLRTRGVPGTHDLSLGLKLMAELKAATVGTRVAIPHFDKAQDDRSPMRHWSIHTGPVDVILIEGWCVGAQPASLSGKPINALEQEHDTDGRWRAHIETQLLEYQSLFRQIDILVMLKAPSMESIIEWRTLQEQKLAAKTGTAMPAGIMNEAGLLRFIMHYERLTRSMLDTMPEQADVVFYLDKNHHIVNSRYSKHDEELT